MEPNVRPHKRNYPVVNYGGLVLIDGADGVGKSTFAHSLATSTGKRYVHRAGLPEQDWNAEYFAPLHQAAVEGEVWDRFWLSTLVWDEILGRRPYFQDKEYVALCHQAASGIFPPAKAFVVHREPDAIRKTLEQRGETALHIEQALESQKLYIRHAIDMPYLQVQFVDSDLLHLARG